MSPGKCILEYQTELIVDNHLSCLFNFYFTENPWRKTSAIPYTNEIGDANLSQNSHIQSISDNASCIVTTKTVRLGEISSFGVRKLGRLFPGNPEFGNFAPINCAVGKLEFADNNRD